MSNTFTADVQMKGMPVHGNKRAIMGVLEMTDGAAGSSVASGLKVIAGGQLTPKSAGALSQIPPALLILNSNVNGDFKAKSAGSGDSYYVTLWGR